VKAVVSPKKLLSNWTKLNVGWALPRLLTLMEFPLFLVLLYVSLDFALKVYLNKGLSHHDDPHILHEQNPKNGTESTA
jgi:hypothetical protein